MVKPWLLILRAVAITGNASLLEQRYSCLGQMLIDQGCISGRLSMGFGSLAATNPILRQSAQSQRGQSEQGGKIRRVKDGSSRKMGAVCAVPIAARNLKRSYTATAASLFSLWWGSSLAAGAAN
jgi:hypothetical protein